MANPKTGQVDTYNVTENSVDFSDILNEKKLPNTPLLNKVGILNDPVFSTTFQWYDEAFPILNTPLTAAYTSGGGVLTVESTVGILKDTIVKVNSVVYRVTAINSATELAVTPISGADAAHAIGDEVTIISSSAKEGADYEDGHYNPTIERENVTQIIKEYVKITGTQMAVRRKVRGDIRSEEIDNKMGRMRVMLERAAWLGIKVKPTTNDGPRLMGGIDWMIENYDGNITTGMTFSEANFKAFLKTIVDRGGSIAEAWMNATTMDNFMALNSSNVRVDQSAEQVGRNVKSFVSQHGETMLNTSQDIPEGVIYIVDTANSIRIRPLNGRQFQYEKLAKTGDSEKGQLIGEYTLEFKNPDLAGKITLA